MSPTFSFFQLVFYYPFFFFLLYIYLVFFIPIKNSVNISNIFSFFSNYIENKFNLNKN